MLSASFKLLDRNLIQGAWKEDNAATTLYMGPLFIRLSSLELRIASRTQWKRQLQPASWTCPDCQKRRASQRYQHTEAQRQDLSASDDSIGALNSFILPNLRPKLRDAFPQPSGHNTGRSPSSDESKAISSNDIAPEKRHDVKSELKSEAREIWRNEVKEALVRRESYRLLAALRARDNDTQFFADIPSTTISEILKLLDPDHFLAGYQDAYGELSDSAVLGMGRVPLEDLLEDYLQSIKKVIRSVSKCGKKLRLVDYRALLRCTRMCCDGGEADKLWAEMQEARIIPDTACYNDYLGAKCWNGMHVADTRFSFRVTPFTLLARNRARLGRKFANYRMGEGGIKSVVTAIFKDMQRNGIPANQETFLHVMTALAREGDMDAVKAVLKKIFNVDVNAIMSDSYQPTSSETPRISETSPFYPTEQILFTVAHVFGSNNDIPTALRLVDHISQLYSIPIPASTWQQLLTWTFILAQARFGRRATRWLENAGGLPGASVGQLFTTMINPPYAIAPSIDTIKMLLSNARRTSEWDLIRVYLLRADQLEQAAASAAASAYADYRDAVRLHMLGVASVERGHRARALFEAQATRRHRHRRMLRSFVHMLLGKPTLAHIPRSASRQWERRDVPDILVEHGRWAPSLVRYRTLSGVVELRFRTAEEEQGLVERARLRAKEFFVEDEATRTGRLVNGRKGSEL